jgi:hypothetical protein
VKDQLKEFARRLRKFNIKFHLFDQNANALPALLKDLSLSTFDRIEVSNITDSMYVGTENVLRSYGPLLNKENDHSAILALYMNWTGKVPDGRPKDSQELAKKYTEDYMKRFPVSKLCPASVMSTAITNRT